MKLTIGFSPCPNDTFIFDALINNKIDTDDIEFDLVLADVEELNQLAAKQELDITKLSYHAFAYLMQDYDLLSSGSALGNNCGPLLITKNSQAENVENGSIAIPGERTTANFLMQFFAPKASNKTPLLFSAIEDAVAKQEFNFGVIIHENRFTYQQKGLKLVQDLGEHWEKTTGYPIPLGGIAIKQALPLTIKQKVNNCIRKSIEYSFKHNKATLPDFVTQNAQEMDETIMRKHINLYVNDFSINLGIKGKQAVLYMLNQIDNTQQPNIIE